MDERMRNHVSGSAICQICGGSGWIMTHNQNGEECCTPCKCRELDAARNRLLMSGLMRDADSCTFENYRTGSNAQRIDAKQTAELYVKRFQEIQRSKHNSLLFCGQVGAGKTHLGTACSVKLLEQGVSVLYVSYRESMTRLKTLIMDGEAYEKEIESYKNAEVLFLDDFLKGKITESDINIIYEIVNHRYNHKLPFIISTEKTLQEMIRFDEAISSRLIEMARGSIIEFKGYELNYRLFGEEDSNGCI